MLAQLMGANIGEITAVVVRYYGGIMLGTGGLVKAYGGGVQQGLKQLARRRKVPMKRFMLMCNYAQLSGIERLLARFDSQLDEVVYLDRITLTLPYAHIEAFRQTLSDFSRGALSLDPLTP
nr:Patal YigZ family protein [Candidatus Pantoea persica]